MNNNDYTDPDFYIRIWWINKFKIIFITSLFAIFSVFYSLSLNNKFTSTAYLKLVDSGSTSSINQLTSQYSNLASLAGIDLSNQGGNSAEEVIKMIYSREFLNHLLNFDDVKVNIVAAKSFDFISNDIIYDEDLYDYKNSIWKRAADVKKNRVSEPSYVEVFDDFYIEKISASKDKLSGLIFISFEHPSPYFAQHFIELLINELNETTRNKDIEDFNRALLYLSDQQKNYTNTQIKKTLSKLEEKYIELQMLAKSKKDYLVESIDPPYLPEEKSYPSRAVLCITITILGFMFSLFFVAISNIFYLHKKQD